MQRTEQCPEMTGVVLAGSRLKLSERIPQRVRRLQSKRWSRSAKEQAQLDGDAGIGKMLR